MTSDETLLQLATRLALPDLPEVLGPVMARAPDPVASTRRTESLLEAAAGWDTSRLQRVIREAPASLARVVWAVCGTAPFLTRFFTRAPERLLVLLEDDLATPRSPEQLESALDRELAMAGADTPAALRRFKYAELARITVRDCAPDLVPEARVEVLLEHTGPTSRLITIKAPAALARRLEHLDEEESLV